MLSTTARRALGVPGGVRSRGAARPRPSAAPRRGPASRILGGGRGESTQDAARVVLTRSVLDEAPDDGFEPREYCDPPGTVKEIPIFPLNVVALPAADTPLQVFEARYRVLFSTLLAGEDGIDNGLVQDDALWHGTKKFGMCLVDSNGGLAAIGTTLYIRNHEKLADGRLMVFNTGTEKFRVLNVVAEKPVLVCQVEVLEDEDDDSQEAKDLALEVVELFETVVVLNQKMRGMESANLLIEKFDLADRSPRDVSYFVASLFGDSRTQQQSLLEEETTMERLQRIKDVLDDTAKYLTATIALKGAFGESGTEAEEPDV